MDILLVYAELALICVGLLVGVIAGGVWFVRAFVRRTAGVGSRSVALGLGSAMVTALLAFVLVYVSAWAEMRQQVVIGDSVDSRVTKLEMDFGQIKMALLVYTNKHEQYPDSLDQLPDFKDQPLVDPWDHPYQYSKTDKGYSLGSLGRDGKPGGTGLDADIDSDHVKIDFEPTLSQFLFESVGSRMLFRVAIMASLFAGLACYVASGPRGGRPASAGSLLFSIAVTTVGALVVSLFLISIYLAGNHH